MTISVKVILILNTYIWSCTGVRAALSHSCPSNLAAKCPYMAPKQYFFIDMTSAQKEQIGEFLRECRGSF